MLCQLSYAGTQPGIVAAFPAGLGQLEDRVLDPRELGLQLLHLVELRVCELSAQPALAEVQE